MDVLLQIACCVTFLVHLPQLGSSVHQCFFLSRQSLYSYHQVTMVKDVTVVLSGVKGKGGGILPIWARLFEARLRQPRVSVKFDLRHES